MDKLNEYLKYREKIRTGDAILWKGKGLLSWLIRRWSKYSHASLVIRLHKYEGLVDRVFMVEALSHGLKLTLLSERIKDYDGEVFWLPAEMNEIQRISTIRYALVECAETDGYDYEGLFKNVFGRVSQDADKLFCSEFVWQAWIKADRVKERPNKKAPRPGDLPAWLPGEEVRIAWK